MTWGELLGALEAFLRRLEANPSYNEVKGAAGELRPLLTSLLHPEQALEEAAAAVVTDAEAAPPEETIGEEA
jgi:hypothetical protein